MSFMRGLAVALDGVGRDDAFGGALPPNIRIIVPSMPSNLTCPLSRVLTSARAGRGGQGQQERTRDRAEPLRPRTTFDDFIRGLRMGCVSILRHGSTDPHVHRRLPWLISTVFSPLPTSRVLRGLELRTCARACSCSPASLPCPHNHSNKTIVTVGTPPSRIPTARPSRPAASSMSPARCRRTRPGDVAPKGDVKGQTTRVIERMRAVLTAAGSSLEQVVAVTVYLKSGERLRGDERGLQRRSGPRIRRRGRRSSPTSCCRTRWSRSRWSPCRTAPSAWSIHPAGWSKSPSPYSYAIRTGDTLFLSGLVSRNGRDNSVVTGDITAQTAVVLDNAGEHPEGRRA